MLRLVHRTLRHYRYRHHRVSKKYTTSNHTLKTSYIRQMQNGDQKKEMRITLDDFQKQYGKRECMKEDHFRGSVSCVYLLNLGRYGDLRKIFNIVPFTQDGNSYDDDEFIVKYGRTNNLQRRMIEHKSEFKKYGLNDISIVDFIHVDPANLGTIEVKLKDFIQKLGCQIEATNKEGKTFKEFAILRDNLKIIWEICIDLRDQLEQNGSHDIVDVKRDVQRLEHKISMYEAERLEYLRRDEEHLDRISFMEKSLLQKDYQITKLLSSPNSSSHSVTTTTSPRVTTSVCNIIKKIEISAIKF